VPDPDPPDLHAAPVAWRDRLDLLTSSPQLTPGRIATGGVAVLVLLAVAWFVLRTPTGPPTETLLPIAGSGAEPTVTTSTTASVVVVHAAGAVREPGVYRLAGGARVADLIDAAGGPAPDADLDQLNLAAAVADGERVYVPRVGEVVVAAPAGAHDATGPLDLNTATIEQLDALPGVGPATARAIIDERERRGGFRSVEDLLDVRGIGPAKLEQLRGLVKV
jgi:competence protein ComEA